MMKRLVMATAAAGLILASSGPVEATIADLVVEPASGTLVNVNDTFRLDIWARFSESGQWNSADLVFEWDPNYLQLDGEIHNPFFSMSWWPSHAINSTWADGDAAYSVVVFVENVTQDTRVVSLNFTALAPVSLTRFDIVHAAGAYPSNPTTKVIDPTTSTDCLGQVYGVAMRVIPEPASLTMALLGLATGWGLLRRKAQAAPLRDPLR